MSDGVKTGREALVNVESQSLAQAALKGRVYTFRLTGQQANPPLFVHSPS